MSDASISRGYGVVPTTGPVVTRRPRWYSISETLEKLAPTIARLQGDDITRAATQVTNFYEEVGAEVAEDVGVDYRKRLAETVRARLPGG
jgi:hypothetical protein